MSFAGGSGNWGTQTSSATLPQVAPSEGYLLIVGLRTNGVANVVPPGDWTVWPAAKIEANDVYLHIYSKRTTANEPSSYEFTWTGNYNWQGVILAYDGNVAVDHVAVTDDLPAADSFSLPAVNASNGYPVVAIGQAYASNVQYVASDFTVSYPKRVVQAEQSNGPFMFAGDITSNTSGLVDPGSITFNQSIYWGGASISLKLAATAPSAPALTAPANGSYADASTFKPTATYNVADGSSQMTGVQLRVKTSQAAAYSYYNPSTGTLQASPVTSALSASPRGSFVLSLPAGVLGDGNIYNWSYACVNAKGTGPFANDFTFTAQAAPSVVLTAPTGTVSDASRPNFAWTATLPSGAAQIAYELVVEKDVPNGTTVPGSGTQVWASGSVSSSESNAESGVDLPPGPTYTGFVRLTETGGQQSNWGSRSFTLTVGLPATPILTAEGVNADDTSAPAAKLVVTPLDNVLSAADASFEGNSAGTWWGYQASVAPTLASSLDGSYSLAVYPHNKGQQASAVTGMYPVVAGRTYTGLLHVQCGNTPNTVQAMLQWADSNGNNLGQPEVASTDSTGGYTKATVTAVAPPNTATVQLTANIPTALKGIGDDSGPNDQPLTVTGSVASVPSPSGGAFGNAMQVSANGSGLLGPIGSGVEQGTVAGTAFTAECRVQMPGTATGIGILGRWGAPDEWLLYTPGTGELQALWGPDTLASGITASADTTYELALSWDGSTLRYFVNGALAASLGGVTTGPTVGQQPLGIAQMPSGYGSTAGTIIDEVRISNIARYTAAYTLDTTPFTADANTVLLYHFDPEEHDIDECGIFPGTPAQWTEGGFVGATTINVEFSGDSGTSWYPVRNGSVAVNGTQDTVVVYDYEGALGVTRQYRAQVVSSV